MIIRLSFFVLTLFSFAAQAAESRALKIVATDAQTKQTGEVALYNKSVAVIIGIDQYANLPVDKQLTYAVKDAKGVADVLKRQYKFDQIISLYDKQATRKAIIKLLEVDLPKQLGKEDALFIFWAGHGNQQSSDEGDIGYLIPHDGVPDDIPTNLTMSEIRDTVSKVIPAKHIFYVMDACYSGLLADTRSLDRTPRRDLAYLQDMTKERVRQVLTAGAKDQQVLDGGANGHSVFTGRLIEILEKTGDFVTANEIQAIIREKVNGDARARNHKQTPSYGTLYGTGDFVFIPSLEQKVADNRAEIAKLEAELKTMDANSAAHRLAATKAEAEQARRALEGKLKAEQLKKEQLAAEEKRRIDESAERQRLLAAKSEDDIKLAALKAAADAKRKITPTETAGDFPTVESAVAEIKRLNQQINSIEAGYEKELAQTKLNVSQRYAKQLMAVENSLKDEFETSAAYKERLSKQLTELSQQRDFELARLSVANLSRSETDPLRTKIKKLADREYILGAEFFTTELGAYDADAQQFTIALKSKVPNIKLALNGSVPLPLAEAKTFKQQWVAGLVRPEGKLKAGSDNIEIALTNDADNMRFTYLGNSFLTPKMKLERERMELIRITPSMVTIQGRGYEIGMTEITQSQWRSVMGDNLFSFSSCDNCPVDNVSWKDVQQYLVKLNTKTGKQYRLPTENEWDFACFGGHDIDYCGSNNPEQVAWYIKNSSGSVQMVGQKLPNSFGIYDMSGNVSEWVACQNTDCASGMIRGGFINSSEDVLSVSSKNSSEAGIRFTYSGIGFRLARTLP